MHTDSPHSSGSASPAPDPPLCQDAYHVAAQHYFDLARTMHRVLMDIHTGTWAVDHGAYGAYCSSCLSPDGEPRYAMNYARSASLTDSPEEIQRRAVAALSTEQFRVTTSEFGADEVDQYNVIATGEGIERAVVRISTATGRVRVTAVTSALPGPAHEVNLAIFGDAADDLWRRLPAHEGPDSEPQFHFPPGSPLHYGPDGAVLATPLTPQ